MTAFPARCAAAEGLACCHTCYKLAPETAHACPRCGAALHLRTPDSLQRTLALLVTASILYIPANVLPIMTTEQLGRSIDSTILGGVILLVDMGSYPVAAVIFVASVLVPLGKLFTLYWLCWSVHRNHLGSRRERTRLYRITEFIGRWSMVDVFVVTVLVALIQLGGLLRITPGAAAMAFGGVVIVTILAAESFDSRLIWDARGDRDG
jgi:paraquat-inducible protein A